jgi:hypothetical protein
MDPFKEEIARYLPIYLTEKTYADLIAYLRDIPETFNTILIRNEGVKVNGFKKNKNK